MTSQLQWQDKDVVVNRKAMKTLRLKIDQQGNIRVSCPHFMSDVEIRNVLDEKANWILTKLTSITALPEEPKLLDGTTVKIWGKPYQIAIKTGAKNQVLFDPESSRLHFTQKHISPEQTEKLLNDLYRRELKAYIQKELPMWQQKMNVDCSYWNIKNMRSKWGSCNVSKKRIWLSLNLTKYPKQCAQMVLVHELVHLLEASHNRRFYQLMDTFLPAWKAADKLLESR